MRPPRVFTAALLAPVLLALSAGVSAAAEIVPPGNSAASQYTEAFPTTGGERETEDGRKGKVVPADTLGVRKTKQLESRGNDGKAVAEFTAETAPTPVATEAPQGGDSGSGGDDKSSGGGPAAAGNGGGDGSGSGQGSPSAAGRGDAATVVTASVEQPSGSSGVSEVLGEATGSSSGKLGLLLPLIVIGAIVWSLFYLWRQRQHKQRVA